MAKSLSADTWILLLTITFCVLTNQLALLTFAEKEHINTNNNNKQKIQ